jgi:hypothetical protein
MSIIKNYKSNASATSEKSATQAQLNYLGDIWEAYCYQEQINVDFPIPKNFDQANNDIVRLSKLIKPIAKTEETVLDMYRLKIISDDDCTTEFDAKELCQRHRQEYFEFQKHFCSLSQVKFIQKMQKELGEDVVDTLDANYTKLQAKELIDKLLAEQYERSQSRFLSKKIFDTQEDYTDRSRDREIINNSEELQKRSKEERLYIFLTKKLGRNISLDGYPDFNEINTEVENITMLEKINNIREGWGEELMAEFEDSEHISTTRTRTDEEVKEDNKILQNTKSNSRKK